MKTILRLLVAGLVFVTPSAAVAVEGVASNPNCYIASVPHRAECLILGQRVTFA